MKLVHSIDDNGWYWQDLQDFATSQLFDTETIARLAKANNTLEWEK